MLDFSQFKYLTFDCYGTLINWEAGLLAALRPILEAHGKPVPDADLLELYGSLEAEAERPPYTLYRDVLRLVVRGIGKKLGFTPSLLEEESLPQSLARWRPWPDTVPALKELKSKYKLAIISNVDDDLFAPTSRHLQVVFDDVVTAGQARCYKPGLAIFQMALERLGASASQILHIGQSIHHDVVPAQSLRIKTVWVNRPSARPNVGAVVAASGKPDLEVRGLAELAKMAAGNN